MEAIHFAVPMVGFPIFVEQKHTATVAQKRGIAIAMPPQTDLADVHEMIVTAIQDPK